MSDPSYGVPDFITEFMMYRKSANTGQLHSVVSSYRG